MKIIGLGHYSRTGKDSLANYVLKYLPPHLTGRKIPFAWKLKQICHDLYGWAGLREPEFYDTPEGAPFREVKLPGLDMTPVEVWVAFGTPAVRENVYPDTWIDYVLKTDHGVDVLIVPDVRFPNEVSAMRDADATLIKVVRPGYGPRNTVADLALKGYRGWDYVVGQSGKMSELDQWGRDIADWLGGGPQPAQCHETQMQAYRVEAA